MVTCPFGPALPNVPVADCTKRCPCGPHNNRELVGAAIVRDLLWTIRHPEDETGRAIAVANAERWWQAFHDRVDVRP